MNRREFLKAMGMGTASLATPGYAGILQQLGGKTTKDQILDQADNRIEKFRKGDVVLKLLLPDGKSLEPGTTLDIQQTNHKFLFGCNIFKLGRCRTAEDNAAYQKHVATLLNFATLPFYWWNYEPQRGKPDDVRTEELVRWCKAHNVTTKGHPLAWNWGEPPWLPDEPEAAMRAQFERIQRCVRRFKNDITIWDVVNEATHYDRPEAKKAGPTLTEAIRRMGVGAYVRGAFNAARQANPKATLVINDYRTDASYAENVISQLVDDNGQALYDVIGIQSHQYGGPWPVKKIWEVCERFAKFGRPLHFTEVTFLSGKQGWDLKKKSSDPNFRWQSTQQGEKRQAEDVMRFYTVLFSHPSVEAITWWDFTDQGAWQAVPAGLLRADMTPKPAYNKLHRLIKGKWWTKTKAGVAANGRASFRGFYGQYKVAARIEDRQITGTFSFDKTTKKIVTVQLG